MRPVISFAKQIWHRKFPLRAMFSKEVKPDYTSTPTPSEPKTVVEDAIRAQTNLV